MKHLQKHIPWLGAAILSVWTILRHITNGINMDVTGQIGLVGQWMHGLSGGAELGPTNYVVKMPLYYVMNHLTFISPRLRLLLLALICNLLAYGLIYWLGKKLLKQAGIKDSGLWQLAIMWLGLLAGRVFWVDYANSRNLEIAGGLAVVVLFLTLLTRIGWQKIIGLTLLAGLVFFADPLEMYILLPPLLVYGGVVAYKHRSKAPLLAAAALLAGMPIAKVLKLLSTWLLPIHYAQLPRIHMEASWATCKQIMSGVTTSTLRLFDINFAGRALGPNTLRQLFGVMILGGIIWVLARNWGQIKSPIKWLLLGILAWNYVVYVASGNALFAVTERYIVWVAIGLVLLIGLAGDVIQLPKIRRSWFMLMTASAVLLVGAFAISWPQRFSRDVPTVDTAKLAQSGQYDYIIASWQLATPANYFAGYAGTPVLPVVCLDGQHIQLRDMFYDAGGWAKLGQTKGKVALLLPETGIDSGPMHCSKVVVLSQLGNPALAQTMPSVGNLYELSGKDLTLQSLRPQ